MPSNDLRKWVIKLTDEEAQHLARYSDEIARFGYPIDRPVFFKVWFQISRQLTGQPSWAIDDDAVPDRADVVDYVARLKEITG